MKTSFILHLDSLDVLNDLNNEQKAELFQAIYDYHKGNDIKLSGLMKAVFTPFKNQFERDLQKYDAICERNKQNGKTGGRPKNPNKPTGLSGNPDKPIKPDNDNDNDNDNDSDNEIDNESDVDEECYEDSEDSDVSCIEVNTKNNETLLINSNKEIIKIDLDGFGYVAGKLLQSNKKDYDVFIQPDYFKIIYH